MGKGITEDNQRGQKRTLDFVRIKFKEIKSENKRLRERVSDLEQTLSIVQTAQEWTMGKGMTQEQADKMREIKGLLEQAKMFHKLESSYVREAEKCKNCTEERARGKARG